MPSDNQFASESGDSLQGCPDCGRKFNLDSFGKHKKICRKVFKSKRKVFDTAKIRLSAIEDYFPGSSSGPHAGKKRRSVPDGTQNGNSTSWRQKSAQFRAAIGAMRKENGSYPQINIDDLRKPSRDESLTRCPHCDRGFNEDAAKRHIAVCQKLFGTRPDGGRLMRGAGTLSHSTLKRSEFIPSASTGILGRSSQKARK